MRRDESARLDRVRKPGDRVNSSDNDWVQTTSTAERFLLNARASASRVLSRGHTAERERKWQLYQLLDWSGFLSAIFATRWLNLAAGKLRESIRIRDTSEAGSEAPWSRWRRYFQPTEGRLRLFSVSLDGSVATDFFVQRTRRHGER